MKQWRSRGGPDRSGADEGFSLVEVIVSLSIIVIVLVIAAPFFVRTLQSSAGLGQRQVAVTIANARLQYLRSLTPSQLVVGRASADVVALNASPGLVDLSQDVVPSLAGDALKDYDPNAVASTNAVVPLTQTETVKNVVYTTRTFINVCYLATSTGLCTKTSSTGPAQYRVDLDVAWRRTSGTNCSGARPGMCEYVVTTIRNPSADPIFSSATSPTVISMTSNPIQVLAANVTVHRGQRVALTVIGTDFTYSTALSSQDPADTVTYSAPTTTTTLNGTFMSSLTGALGGHVLNVVNGDGTSTTTYLTVTKSAPTIATVTPAIVLLPAVGANTSYSFTLTGTDLYATPTLQPVISFSGTRSPLASPTTNTAVSYAATNVSVSSPSSLTFNLTFPGAASPGYKDSGTLTLTNPDGSTTTIPFTVTV